MLATRKQHFGNVWTHIFLTRGVFLWRGKMCLTGHSSEETRLGNSLPLNYEHELVIIDMETIPNREVIKEGVELKRSICRKSRKRFGRILQAIGCSPDVA